MKELLDQLRATAERCKQHGEVARMTGIMLAVNDLEAYLARCAPKTAPPTVEAFRKHESVHGPWVRVKEDGRWLQGEVFPRDMGDGTTMLHVLKYTTTNVRFDDARQCRHYTSLTPIMDETIPAWQWSDADGNAVPGPE